MVSIIGKFGPENAQMSSSQCGDHSCSLLPSVCDSACLKFKVTGLRGKPAVGRHNPLIGHYEEIHPASKIHAEFTQCFALRKLGIEKIAFGDSGHRLLNYWLSWASPSWDIFMRNRGTGPQASMRQPGCGCHVRISAEGMRMVPLQFWSTVKWLPYISMLLKPAVHSLGGGWSKDHFYRKRDLRVDGWARQHAMSSLSLATNGNRNQRTTAAWRL